MAKRKIGIYGGTFSPPHIGHVGAAESFSRAIEPDELLIMPDFLPPHKELLDNVSAEDRLEMSRLAFGHIKNVEVSDMEIKRGGRSYTSVTLEELSSEERELYFLCGTDMFLTLGTWYRPQVIFRLATICYVRREKDAENSRRIEELTRQYQETFNAKIIPIDLSVKEVSSSQLREYLQNSDSKASDLLTPGVYDYIRKRGLYV